MNTKTRRPSPAYWSDRNLMNSLGIALEDLAELERRFCDTPRYYPYSQAADALYTLAEALWAQLKADDRNPYWKQHPAPRAGNTGE